MTDLFFEKPILNSPYEYPKQHWELDKSGMPTQKVMPYRRRAEFIVPIAKARVQRGQSEQQEIILDSSGLSTQEQQYDDYSVFINAMTRTRWVCRGVGAIEEGP